MMRRSIAIWLCVLVTLNALQFAISQRCQTTDGKDCIFPFIYRQQTSRVNRSTLFNGCPKDPDDSSKTWCSTKVDSNGVHIKGNYGTCGPACPKACGQPVNKNNCPASSCRPLTQCASRISADDLCSKTCKQANGASGLCCDGDVTFQQSQVNDFPPFEDLGVRGSDFEDNFLDVRSANLEGEKLGREEHNDISRRKIKAPTRGSPSSGHGNLNHRAPGVKELAELGKLSYRINAQFAKGNKHAAKLGTRGADLQDTRLNGCYELPNCDFNSPYRTADGACNNRGSSFHKEGETSVLWGSRKTPLSRILENDYEDGNSEPKRWCKRNGKKPLPSAREVSNALWGSDDSPSSSATMMVMQFGQFVDHDVALSPFNEEMDCCSDAAWDSKEAEDCFTIHIPRNDPFTAGLGRKPCQNLVRSDPAPKMPDCSPGPRQQMNQITSWLDSSNVYGSDDITANLLRARSGGLLKSEPRSGGREKELLPPRDTLKELGQNNGQCREQGTCFAAGDQRVNEQPNLAVMHTLFLREHNRIARELQSINRQWNDEKLYQESRRILNAEYQHILYNEFLPKLIGRKGTTGVRGFPINVLTRGFSRDYSDKFDSRLMNEFSTAAYRVGHSLIPGLINMFSTVKENLEAAPSLNNRRQLKDFFNNPSFLRDPRAIDELLVGLTLTPVERADDNFATDVLNHLFENPIQRGQGGPGSEIAGFDLTSLNVQRGRDHGLQGYVEYLHACNSRPGNRGGRKPTTFQDLRPFISESNIRQLQEVYDSVDDIDLYSGMTQEEPEADDDGLVGGTFRCLIHDQFARLKKGDRFFYDLEGQAGSLKLNQLDEIRKVSMARLICDNSDHIKAMQPLAFERLSDWNKLTDCSKLPRVNLGVFRG